MEQGNCFSPFNQETVKFRSILTGLNRQENLLKKCEFYAYISIYLKENTTWRVANLHCPLPLSQCCFEGRTMTQPFFQRQSNIDEGEAGGGRAELLTYHCSRRIWRSTKSFLTVLSTISDQRYVLGFGSIPFSCFISRT